MAESCGRKGVVASHSVLQAKQCLRMEYRGACFGDIALTEWQRCWLL